MARLKSGTRVLLSVKTPKGLGRAKRKYRAEKLRKVQRIYGHKGARYAIATRGV